MITPPVHRWPVRVYYEDTDFSGVVYHASYLRFLERGRTECLRAAGVDQGVLFAAGCAFAVRAMTLDFRAPARMDEEVVVTTSLTTLGGASIEMDQAVLRAGARLLEAHVRVGLVGGGRAVRLPRAVADRLRTLLLAP